MGRTAKLIEPINASFESVLRVLVKAPEQELSDITIKPTSLAKWIGKNHCADNIGFMNTLPPESVSCIVTSPPYNLKNSTGNGMKDGRGGKWPNASLQNGYDNHSDVMEHDKYVEWQRDCLTSMMRLLKPDGVIFYNHKWRVQNGLIQDRHDIVDGFPVRQIIIWKRAGGINFNEGYFLPTYEVIYMICKPDFKLAPKANKMGDVWEIPQVKGNDHPAPFPTELAQRCIESTPGGVVLDPFMGSGTTAIAALTLNREWIGIDNSQKYCNMADSRVKEFIDRVNSKLPPNEKTRKRATSKNSHRDL